jgi:hypothetical protein
MEEPPLDLPPQPTPPNTDDIKDIINDINNPNLLSNTNRTLDLLSESSPSNTPAKKTSKTNEAEHQSANSSTTGQTSSHKRDQRSATPLLKQTQLQLSTHANTPTVLFPLQTNHFNLLHMITSTKTSLSNSPSTFKKSVSLNSTVTTEKDSSCHPTTHH